MYFISGSFRGWIKKYLINPDSLDSGSFEKLEDEWDGLREGSATRISFANLNNDKYLEAVVGNDRGGVTVFKSPLVIKDFVNSKEVFSEKKLPYKIFPNPTNDFINIVSQEEVNVTIYDALGKEVYFLKNIYGNKNIDLNGFNNGIYFLKIEMGDKIFSEKIILNK